MQEKVLRKWHRNMGIILALFIILQAITGLLITVDDLEIPLTHAHENIAQDSPGHQVSKSLNYQRIVWTIHHGGGSIGVVYRILLGIGMVGMAVSGSMIYLKIRKRTRKR